MTPDVRSVTSEFTVWVLYEAVRETSRDAGDAAAV